MVSSPMYERLKVFMEAARANRGLAAWDSDHEKTIQGFEQAIDRLKAYRDGHGFTGKTGDAMDQWVDRSISRIEEYRRRYQQGYNTYVAGRQVMANALKEAELLSPDLLDAKTAAMRGAPLVAVPESEPGGGVSLLGMRFTTGEAYASAVEEQNNAQREAAASRVLNMVNGLTTALGAGMTQGGGTEAPDPGKDIGEDFEKPRGGTEPGSGNGSNNPSVYSSGNGFGRQGGRSPSSGDYPGGFDQPWWSEADAAAARNRTVASGALPTREPSYGDVGSRTNPITDPQDLMDTDLLHRRVNGTAYRNGVVGGHTPAPAADVDHPLWRLNGGRASDSSAAGRLGGAGVLGAGALGMRGAARMGSGGLGAAGGLKVGSYSGSGFGSYTPPSTSAGANGTAGSGASGVTGAAGANGSGAAGAAGSAGKGGAGGRGFMGGGAGAGAGAGKQDRKGRKRKYVAFTFDEGDEDGLPRGYVNPLSQMYGNDQSITPAKRVDDGWDPRQW
ncbi:hypothetical protein I6H42_00030 [Schaalia meyeri]|uniref:Uncharacterized protein n=1 Tax=Schaalia meyeri TaxID=52773 RepID=A0AAP9Y6W2_9ACTO|nr:hypothetical protein [Schaalia meyeri]QQC43874.1 hypothetical protein I6H42_00030 [Schaalia meyeri]SDR75932.1 hypothetical protein SAMN04489715_0982 [Schaalia meyeri]